MVLGAAVARTDESHVHCPDTLLQVRECQLKLPRADTGPHAALMDR